MVLWKSLQSARRTGAKTILAVDAAAAGMPTPRVSMSAWARLVPPEAFLNLRPYRPLKAVIAAGGIVVRQGCPEILLIERHGIWDLPKGKRARGEDVAECALREVSEETGIMDLKMVRLLGDTMHGYVRGGRYWVKETYWYLMRSNATTFVPAGNEGIERVEWVPWKCAEVRLGHAMLQQFIGSVAMLVENAFTPSGAD